MDETIGEAVVTPAHAVRSRPQRGHPFVPVVVAIGLFVVIFVLRLAVSETDARITGFYVVPIAVLATVYGLRVGALAACAASVLVVAWVEIDGISQTPLVWVGLIVPLVLVGLLVGETSDRLRAASIAESASFASRLGAVEAAEIRDLILPPLAAARESLEAGRVPEGLAALTEGIIAAERLKEHLGPGDP